MYVLTGLGQGTTLAEEPKINMARAIARNRHYGKALGWAIHFNLINPLLGFTNYSPIETVFAQGVARWQSQQPGLTPDGILGPNTWQRMRQQLTLPLAPSRACPAKAAIAKDRCNHPGRKTCQPIPDLLCAYGVDGVPFEYPKKDSIQKDPTTGLFALGPRIVPRVQRFVPPVATALSQFLKMMKRNGMPIEAMITAGSVYCRCIRKTDKLSNHAFGDAIDIVGVRWASPKAVGSRVAETLVHNFRDPEQRGLLRRLNACLRLSFSTVIDYNYNKGHQDHFHCDMDRKSRRAMSPTGKTTMAFAQEALTVTLGRSVPISKRFDRTTQQAVADFSGLSLATIRRDRQVLRQVLDDLFTKILTSP